MGHHMPGRYYNIFLDLSRPQQGGAPKNGRRDRRETSRKASCFIRSCPDYPYWGWARLTIGAFGVTRVDCTPWVVVQLVRQPRLWTSSNSLLWQSQEHRVSLPPGGCRVGSRATGAHPNPAPGHTPGTPPRRAMADRKMIMTIRAPLSWVDNITEGLHHNTQICIITRYLNQYLCTGLFFSLNQNIQSHLRSTTDLVSYNIITMLRTHTLIWSNIYMDYW